MPIARTWSEELVIEWMSLKGYLVELGVPIMLGKPGRNEVDAVGVRHDGNTLEILHVEVGTLSGGDPEGSVNAKFDPKITKFIESHIKTILNFTGNANYLKIYVATYKSKAFDSKKVPGIEVVHFDDFVKAEVVPTIKRWKKNNTPSSGFPPELPESLWLLKFYDNVGY